MLERLDPIAHPGVLFLAATLVPLASFTVLLLAGGFRNFLRARGAEVGGTGLISAWVATGAIMLSCVLCVIGGVRYFGESHALHAEVGSHGKKIRDLES